MRTPMAVVGMACRFPDANNLAAFWQNMLERRVSFRAIGDERWSHSRFYHPSPRELDKTYAKNGAFIDGVDRFAALHFGIPPKRAEVMDPQQRLFLEVVRDAIDDAGYGARDFDRSRTGVFVGASVNEYKDLVTTRHRAMQLGAGDFGQALPAGLAETAADAVAPSRAFNIAGGLLNMMAATVAQTFDWQGPAFSIDAACASALVAIVQAAEYLASLPEDLPVAPLAVAGGVYLNLTPDNLIGFSRIGAISPDFCRPFDSRANGFVMGEGGGVVVLKRLHEALRDGDRVYAVLRGAAWNNDGRGDGPMTPRLSGQQALLRDGLAAAGVTAVDVGYVECHGTGTAVGDNTELTALHALHATSSQRPRIGSVKANIGHTMSAAGVAGFIRATLAVHHGVLPPQAGFDAWHPALAPMADRFDMATTADAWTGEARAATVSSFGFGGTNAFAVLTPQAAATQAESSSLTRVRAATPAAMGAAPTEPPVGSRLFLWSSDTPETLAATLQQFGEAVGDDAPLSDLSWTTCTRERGEWTAAVVAESTAQLLTRVDDLVKTLAQPAKALGFSQRPGAFIASREALGKIAFLFPGQGAQTVGAFGTLRATLPGFDDRLRALGGDVIHALLYPTEAGGAAQAALTRTENAQPTLAALELALFESLRALGATPDAVIGHSLGEFVAAAASGRLEAEETVRFVRARGEHMAAITSDEPSGLLAVKASRDAARALAERFGLTVSNVNHPEQSVLAGTVAYLADVAKQLTSEGIAATPLQVSHAFHSPFVARAARAIAQEAAQLTLRPATLAQISSTSVSAFPTDDVGARALFADHTLAAVDFLGALQLAFDQGVRTFIQIGPGKALSQCATKTFGPQVTTLSLGTDESTSWLLALGLCAAAGQPLQLSSLYRAPRLIDLRPTLLDRQRYWAVSGNTHRKELVMEPKNTSAADAVRLLEAQLSLMKEQTALIQRLLSPLASPPAPTQSPLPPVNVPVPVPVPETNLPAPALAPALAPAFSPRPHAELRTNLLTLVAKISAYPLASLRDDMTLGDELGFDSLMLVELATAIRDSLGVEISREVWATQPSIGALIAVIASGTSLAATTAPNSSSTSARNAAAGTAPANTSTASEDTPTANAANVTTSPTQAPQARWFTPRLVPIVARAPSSLTALTPDDIVILKAPTDAAVRAALAAKPKALVWAIPAEPAHERELALGKALSVAAEHPGVRVRALIYQANADIASAAAALSASAHPWATLTADNNLLVEAWSELAVLPNAAPSHATASSAAITTIKPLRAGHTIAVAHHEHRIAHSSGYEAQPHSITSSDVVLVTGGASEIALAAVAELCATGAKFVLVGRRALEALPPATQDAIKRANVRYVSASLATDSARVIKKIKKDLGDVTAVIHAAGVIADARFDANQDSSAVSAAKVDVVTALKATIPSPRFVVALSSWSAAFGNYSQSAYAAANRAMENAIAGWGSRQVALRLPPIDGTTMTSTIPSVVRRELERSGVQWLSLAQAADAVAQACLGDASGIALVGQSLPPFALADESPAQTRLVSSFNVSLESHRYLTDHQIHRVPTLPLAGALDLFALADALEAPFTLSGIEVHEGLPVDHSRTLSVRRADDRRELWFDDPSGKTRLAFSAQAKGYVAPIVAQPDEPAWRAPTLPLEEFYRLYTFHGASLRGIRKLTHVSDHSIEGIVATSTREQLENAGSIAPWKLDPLVVDSAFQLALYFAQTEKGRAALPIAIAEVIVLAPFGHGDVHCRLDLEDITDNDFTGTIRFTSAEGALLVLMRGVKGKLLPSRLFASQETQPAPEIPEEHYRIEALPAYLDLKQRLSLAHDSGLKNPYFTLHQGVTNNRSTIGGRELLNFSSYNYLGLSGDPRVTKAAQEALTRYGTSVSASRIASGEKPLHRELEKKIAQFVGVDDSIVYVGGYVTNVTTIGHLFGPGDLVLHDALIHDSILQGIKLSGAARRPFPHNDPQALDRTLRMLRAHYKRVLIVIEGTYSMDGDLPDLPAFIALRDRHKCFLMVDEAHSIGVLGKTGRGVGEHFDVDRSKVDLWMGTLSKSLASCGGYIAGSAALVEYLKYTAPGFVYSVGLPPPNAAASLRALQLIEEEPERVTTLHSRAAFFVKCCAEAGLNTGLSKDSAVVPVIVGDSFTCIQLAHLLFEQGINVNPIIYPAVEDSAARLRFFITSLHEEAELAHTAKVVAQTLASLRSGDAVSAP